MPKRVAPRLGSWRLFLSGLGAVLLAEAVDATLHVDEALLPRVERVTGGANVHRELLPGGARLERVATRAAHAHELVFRVNAVLNLSTPRAPELSGAREPSAQDEACRGSGLRDPSVEPPRERSTPVQVSRFFQPSLLRQCRGLCQIGSGSLAHPAAFQAS